jgi:hypothetical protein
MCAGNSALSPSTKIKMATAFSSKTSAAAGVASRPQGKVLAAAQSCCPIASIPLPNLLIIN